MPNPISQKGTKITPLRISFEAMDMFRRRTETRKRNISPMEESYHMVKAADPGLKETTEMLREFYYPSDDL